jgi:hypothetical protein
MKDNLMAETRKALYHLIAGYIKMRKEKIVDYLDIIYVILFSLNDFKKDKCIRLFKREDSNKCKEGALWPIIQMIK